VEQDHVIQGYTFELGKCYEENVRIRQLEALANIDGELCAKVAEGLGLPAPAPASTPEDDVQPSPALSQLGKSWPLAGRVVGIIADHTSDQDALATAREAIHAGGMVPLIIAPKGGKLPGGLTVQRTYLTARSVEFDAILVAGSAAPGANAAGGRDAKAGDPTGHPAVDPRVSLMLAEAYRHAKAIGGWDHVAHALAAAGIPEEAPGVVIGDGPAVLEGIAELLAKHRVWERFPASA
jgi:catalase